MAKRLSARETSLPEEDLSPPSHRFPGNVLFYLLSLLALATFSYATYVRVKGVRRGKADPRTDRLGRRFVSSMPLVLAQARVARPRYWYSGLLHHVVRARS